MKLLSLFLLIFLLCPINGYANQAVKRQSADKDKDGYVSKAEFMDQQMKRLEKRFNDMDENKDLKISWEERQNFTNKQKSKRPAEKKDKPVQSEKPQQKPKQPGFLDGVFQ